MTASYPIPKNDNTCPDDPPHYWLNSGEHHEKLVASGRFHQPFRSRHGAGGATISIGFSAAKTTGCVTSVIHIVLGWFEVGRLYEAPRNTGTTLATATSPVDVDYNEVLRQDESVDPL